MTADGIQSFVADAQQGFTLVEVLVAVALIGIALAPLMYAYTYSTRLTLETQRVTLANVLARHCLAQMSATVDYTNLDNADCSTTAGDFDPPYGDFHYQTDVQRFTAGSDPNLDLTVLRIKVIFPTLFGDEHRTLSCPSGVGKDGSGCDQWDLATVVTPRRASP